MRWAECGPNSELVFHIWRKVHSCLGEVCQLWWALLSHGFRGFVWALIMVTYHPVAPAQRELGEFKRRKWRNQTLAWDKASASSGPASRYSLTLESRQSYGVGENWIPEDTDAEQPQWLLGLWNGSYLQPWMHSDHTKITDKGISVSLTLPS